MAPKIQDILQFTFSFIFKIHNIFEFKYVSIIGNLKLCSTTSFLEVLKMISPTLQPFCPGTNLTFSHLNVTQSCHSNNIQGHHWYTIYMLFARVVMASSLESKSRGFKLRYLQAILNHGLTPATKIPCYSVPLVKVRHTLCDHTNSYLTVSESYFY